MANQCSIYMYIHSCFNLPTMAALASIPNVAIAFQNRFYLTFLLSHLCKPFRPRHTLTSAMSVKRHQFPCSGSPVDTKNDKKDILNITSNCQWHLLKSWYTTGAQNKDLSAVSQTDLTRARLFKCWIVLSTG